MPDAPPRDVDLLRMAAEIGDLAWFQVDDQRRIVRWSAAVAALTGFTAAEAEGQPCIAAVRCEKCLQGCRLFERGAVDGRGVRMYHKDGGELLVHKTGRVWRHPDGRIGGAVEVLRPEADQRSVDLLTTALHRLWLAADAGCRIVDFSPSLPGRTGLSAAELRGAHLETLFPGDLFAEASDLRRNILGGHCREGVGARLRHAGGGDEEVSLSAGRGPDGRVFVMIRPRASDLSSPEYTEFEGMVGRSPAMLRIFRIIEMLGDNDATALIAGESGTGKELVARALHARSTRARGPFVAVNCGALPHDLLESELFGHVRGAFTGAWQDRQGRFELARGGTLFLDEIGDMPLPLQVKLLRVLDHGGYQRLGDSRTLTPDVRIVAATHVHLREAVADKRFREDLYYRLRVLAIDLPPLRERREDLEPLIARLLEKSSLQRGRALKLSPGAMRALLAYAWPGNVRELQNALEYAIAVCEGQTIHSADLPPEVSGARARPAPPEATPVALPAAPVDRIEADPEAERVAQALADAHYRRDEAARRLGVSRTTLWRKMKAHGLA